MVNRPDWTIAYALFRNEGFNGFGYRNKGLRSPYLWGGTTHQQRGKYVRDGVFDSTVMDTQLGVAAVIKAVVELEPALAIGTATPAPTPQPPRPSLPIPALRDGPLARLFRLVVAALRNLFGR